MYSAVVTCPPRTVMEATPECWYATYSGVVHLLQRVGSELLR